MIFKLCKIPPNEFWDYSPAETILMIQVASESVEERLKYELLQMANLKVTIANAPWAHKKDESLFELSDFLPQEIFGEVKKKKLSDEEIAKRWSSKGREYVNSIKKVKGEPLLELEPVREDAKGISPLEP